ncbi:putative collagen-binding domain of a collagenase-domain-containing protein [Xylariaceae sp. FL1651]|nr:putative collagen-binding domain of a collagenase-domain-containing protein [Xylariaceae sp. FL1651]
MPLVDNEAHYEGRYNNGNPNMTSWTAADVRTGSWQAVLSGGSGFTYGHDMIMQGYVPGVYDPDGSGPPLDWLDAIQAPGSSQMQYLKKVIQERSGSLFSRVPAQDILVGDTGTDDHHVVATRNSAGVWVIVYTPTGKPFGINTSVLKSQNMTASWYDPLSGTYTAVSAGLGSTRTFTPPSNNSHSDWALVLESSS